MKTPTVSFVVPCYKLAHLLADCIRSILAQTFEDFEVVLLDDCSPDDTAGVLQAFDDPRIRYIRNEQNIGHLRNYNKGIAASRGKYVWLISADDYLRRPYVLERYVRVLDQHPTVGYVFCPCYGVDETGETRVWGRYSHRHDRDRILAGHTMLRKLIRSDFVMAPAGMVRRTCYEEISLFPLDMPWCGDWYLWCLFSLYWDVAYLAEPMVCYREHHADSMTNKLTRESLDACAAEEVAVPWSIWKSAREAGHAHLAMHCLAGVAQTHARTSASERFRTASFFMKFDRLEEMLRVNIPEETTRRWVRARVFEGVANERYWAGELREARDYYSAALSLQPWMVSVHIKRALLSLGSAGDRIRRAIVSRH